MSRSPSSSRSKITDEREPRALISATLPLCPLQRGLSASSPSQSIDQLGVGPPAPARLDAEDEFAVAVDLAAVVQQQRIDAIAERKIHAGGDEDVLPAVRVEVAGAQAPGPVVLDVHGVRDLREPAAPQVVEEGVAED